jgi:hypothetical protein
MCAPSWLKEHHGLELRVAQGLMAVAHNPLRERVGVRALPFLLPIAD